MTAAARALQRRLRRPVALRASLPLRRPPERQPDRAEAPLEPALASLIEGREVATVESLMAAPAGHLLRLRLPSRMAIAATEVRRRLQEGLSVRYLIPESVERYIETHELYRESGAGVDGLSE